MKLKDDRMGTFQDLALSDYTLQDAIYVVDGEPTINDRYVGKTEPDQEGKGGSPGQLYADYDLVGRGFVWAYFCYDYRVWREVIFVVRVGTTRR